MLFDDGNELVITKSSEHAERNQYVEMVSSSLPLISEEGQHYRAFIDAVLTEDAPVEDLALGVNPSSLAYYLEPGHAGEMRRELQGEIRYGDESRGVKVTMEPELYSEPLDTVLRSGGYDARIEALAEDSVTLKLDEHPFKHIDSIDQPTGF